MTNKQTILIIEDEKHIGNYMETIVIANQYKALRAMNGLQGLSLCTSHYPDLILLDLGLPDMDGMEVLQRIRGFSNIPVIVVSARNQEREKVVVLDGGADDYITKPFSLMVLRARVERMRFRIRQTESYGYEDERFQFFYDEMRYLADGQEIVLSKTEQKLLKLFTEHIGQTLTREQLIDTLWTGDRKYVDENALSVTVNRLRRKLEGKGRECPIQTVYGLGYVWEKRE